MTGSEITMGRNDRISINFCSSPFCFYSSRILARSYSSNPTELTRLKPKFKPMSINSKRISHFSLIPFKMVQNKINYGSFLCPP